MSDPKTSGAGTTISILDLVSVLVRHRWFIILSSFTAAVFIVVYSLYSIKAAPDAPLNFMPNVFRPTVQVRLQEASSSPLSSLISNSNLGVLANLAGTDVGGSSSADLAQELLTGNTLLDELVEEYDLINKLAVEKAPKATTRKYLRESLQTTYNSATGILTIGFEHTDRYFATDILNSAVKKLEERFQNLSLASVQMRKEILEESIEEYGKELRSTQQALIDFQTQYGIFSIEIQIEYKLEAIAEIDSRILETQTELKTLQATRRAEDPEVRRTREELNQLQEQRDMLVNGTGGAGTPTNIPQSQLPELSARYLNLTRDLQIVQTIYSSLLSQYETLKVEEKDTSSQFHIIEEAEVPELKYKPSRGKICMIFTITAFFLSVFGSFVLEYFDRVKQDPVESEKLRNIKRMFGRKR